METTALVVDTSIFIQYLRATKKGNTVLQKLPNNIDLYISSITIYELFMGGTDQDKWKEVKRLIEDLVVLNFNNETAILASKLYHQLRKQNKMIEFRDIFIAASAIHHDIPLLTLNTKDFSRIKNLKIFESSS